VHSHQLFDTYLPMSKATACEFTYLYAAVYVN